MRHAPSTGGRAALVYSSALRTQSVPYIANPSRPTHIQVTSNTASQFPLEPWRVAPESQESSKFPLGLPARLPASPRYAFLTKRWLHTRPVTTRGTSGRCSCVRIAAGYCGSLTGNREEDRQADRPTNWRN